MAYYDLPQEERKKLKETIEKAVYANLCKTADTDILQYAADADTSIRKNVYLAFGKWYTQNSTQRSHIQRILVRMLESPQEHIRQTAVYALGEIGKIRFEDAEPLLTQALADAHHVVLNAVTGALKQTGKKHPQQTFAFIQQHLHHVPPAVQVKLLHGLELRGRTHPADVLPILEKHQWASHKPVMKMVVHVLGQISYKNGCLEQVLQSLQAWENREIVALALYEIRHVHQNYRKFSSRSPEEAHRLIREAFPTNSM